MKANILGQGTYRKLDQKVLAGKLRAKKEFEMLSTAVRFSTSVLTLLWTVSMEDLFLKYNCLN